MVNRQKIITMTKLALYDKHEGAADREANNYFRHDYIYRKNLGTRISVGIAGVIILAIHWLRIFFVEGEDLFEIRIQDYVMEAVVFLIALLAIYSLIGTIQGTREYYLVHKRLNRYLGMLRFLENADERAVKPAPVPEEPERERRPRRDAPPDSLGGTSRARVERTEQAEEPRPFERPPRRRGHTEHERPQEPLPLTDRPRPVDPLANVSSRALSGSRLRTAAPLVQRRPPAKAGGLPQINLTPPKK
jgi:hypothetical protein